MDVFRNYFGSETAFSDWQPKPLMPPISSFSGVGLRWGGRQTKVGWGQPTLVWPERDCLCITFHSLAFNLHPTLWLLVVTLLMGPSGLLVLESFSWRYQKKIVHSMHTFNTFCEIPFNFSSVKRWYHGKKKIACFGETRVIIRKIKVLFKAAAILYQVDYDYACKSHHTSIQVSKSKKMRSTTLCE